MNGVSSTGFSNGASRSESTKFISQSENDVATAFAELLKYEGIAPPDGPAPPPAADVQRSRSEASNSTSSDSRASSDAATPVPNAASTERAEDESERDEDEEASVVAVAQAVPTQQTQAPAEAASEGVASAEEAELEALLANARSVQQELEADGSRQANDPSAVASVGTPGRTTGFAEELIAAAEANGSEREAAAGDPIAEASPRTTVPAETEILDPLRRAGTLEDGADSEEGFALEEGMNEGGVDEAALAELVAKAAATADGADYGKSDDRGARPESDRGDKADAAAGVEVASQAAQADASAAVVASAVLVENATSTNKADTPAIDAAGATSPIGAAGTREATGSLQRSIERPAETDRRPMAGADLSRFFDRVERAFKTAEQGDGAIRMRLHPSELGSMQLTLEQSETGEWSARIETETLEAKQALLEHAGALKERLADQDFRLGRFEVETPDDRRQQDARDFPENPQSFSRGRDRRDDEKGGDERAGESAPPTATPGDRSRRLDVII